MEKARNEGIDVAGDLYPYEWSSTGFSGAIFPRWALVSIWFIIIISIIISF